MTKIQFDNLKINNNNINTTKVINIYNSEIEIKTYLPLKDKISLIEDVIDKSLVKDAVYCNPILLKAMFELSIVSYYTNIDLGDLYEVDLMELYDRIKSTNILSTVLSIIPEQEYKDLCDHLQACKSAVELENSSVINLIKAGMDRMSDIIEQSSEKLNDVKLDLGSENLKNVLAIAKDNGAI